MNYTVRNARRDYKIKLANQLIDKTIPPGKWWPIAKSVAGFKNHIQPLLKSSLKMAEYIFILLTSSK
jgi:hypothetical protein